MLYFTITIVYAPFQPI
ncbi:hypothetical protein S40285_09710 [Stachybotrys chlorohalonatus IBT 40285]|uniref:Uncharacterized protein n=1 Tax=Stachybotrys chlorohalonatus (strain IBT 40285) TaxID=1283841 RepID=A0A084QTF2_STAC4|nr:hypothetical protein S40285_09710 [Stachybotrys chlorohalonata IBT 40285]